MPSAYIIGGIVIGLIVIVSLGIAIVNPGGIKKAHGRDGDS